MHAEAQALRCGYPADSSDVASSTPSRTDRCPRLTPGPVLVDDSHCSPLCVVSLCHSHKQHQWVPRRGGFNAPGLAPACHTLSRWAAHSIAARGLYRAGAPPAGDSGPHPPPSLTGPRAGPPAVSVLPTASRSLSYNTRTAAGLAGSRRPGSQRHHSRGRRREWGPAGTGVTVTSARIRTS